MTASIGDDDVEMADVSPSPPTHAGPDAGLGVGSPLSSPSSADSDAGADSEVQGRMPASVSPPLVDDRDDGADLYESFTERDQRTGHVGAGSRSPDVTMGGDHDEVR
jgi:hypothetical protein